MRNLKIIISLLWIFLLIGCGEEERKKLDSIVIESTDTKVGEKLELNTNYLFTYHSNKTVKEQTWKLEVYTQEEGAIKVSAFSGNETSFFINIPAITVLNHRDDFVRKDNGMIKAHILLTGTYNDGKSFKTTFNVEFPYKPQKPDLFVKSITDRPQNLESDVTIEFTSHHYVDNYILTEYEPESTFILLNYLPDYQHTFLREDVMMDIGYIIKVRAKNQYGESEDAVLMLGGNPNYYNN